MIYVFHTFLQFKRYKLLCHQQISREFLRKRLGAVLHGILFVFIVNLVIQLSGVFCLQFILISLEKKQILVRKRELGFFFVEQQEILLIIE